MRREYIDWLVQLTGLPTAAGREDAVVAWVRRWAGKRRGIVLRADKFGNLHLSRRGVRSARPIYITAHMDHPAFVVTGVRTEREVEADFRGFVEDRYFMGARVCWSRGIAPGIAPGTAGAGTGGTSKSRKPIRGTVVSLTPAAGEYDDKRVRVRFDGPLPSPLLSRLSSLPSSPLTWDTGPARLEGDRLWAPAIDDLAGVAAALAAFDGFVRADRKGADVRVLLTRAEEIGFVGCIAACKSRLIPKGARILALENSKSNAESPIGAGPIVRVGDKTSTFDPDLTYRVGRIGQDLAKEDPSFRWQRKLMPGGTCEASAFQAYGYISTCICLPLGNYHNMNEATGRIDSETISVADYQGLVRLLMTIGACLDDPDRSPPLRKRLDALFAARRAVLRPSGA